MSDKPHPERPEWADEKEKQHPGTTGTDKPLKPEPAEQDEYSDAID